jgi:carbon monoxide dehydrogenase subunit G
MDMQGSRILNVTQQQAWDALNDPEVLKVCIPGCDKIEAKGDNQYAIGMAVKSGPVSAKFAGNIRLSDIMPPHSYTLGFDGQGGVAGFGRGSAAVKLLAHADGCEMQYSANAQVGGKIAQMGQRLIDGVAKSMAEDFFKRFDDEMQRRYPVAAAPAPADVVVSTQSSQSGIPTWAWVVGAAVLAALVWKFC